jgi:hypothetical protein
MSAKEMILAFLIVCSKHNCQDMRLNIPLTMSRQFWEFYIERLTEKVFLNSIQWGFQAEGNIAIEKSTQHL